MLMYLMHVAGCTNFLYVVPPKLLIALLGHFIILSHSHTLIANEQHAQASAQGPATPKILYKIIQSLRFKEDYKIVTKIVTSPKPP